MQYRRDYTQGANYFFTVVTFQRVPLFSKPDDVAQPRRLGWCFFNPTFIAQCVGLRKDVTQPTHW